MITSKRKQEGQVKDAKKKPSLARVTLSTSRLLDFCNRKELIAQTGHQPDAWPLVILKELIDNALDACEEAGIATGPQASSTLSGRWALLARAWTRY